MHSRSVKVKKHVKAAKVEVMNSSHVHKRGQGHSHKTLGRLQIDIKVYGYTTMFSNIFTKGKNFCDILSASLGDRSLHQIGSILTEKKSSYSSKLLPLRGTQF